MNYHYRWENREKQRFYRVLLTKDLFGDWVITKIWGSLANGYGRSIHFPCASHDEGCRLIEKIVRARSKRGYVLVQGEHRSPLQNI